jgi:ABC-2 type transport system permease protein
MTGASENAESRMSVFFAPYIASMRLAFLKLLAYRFRYFTGIVTYLLFVSVHYFIWKAVYNNGDTSLVINGFTFYEMVTYISVGWIARSLYFSDIDEEIAELVRTGQVSIYLLRPVQFHFIMLSEAFGGLLFRLTLFTLPISAVLVQVYPVALPASLMHGVFFLIATAISFFVFAEINFLLGLVCFASKSIEGIMRAKYFFIQLFSGLLLPIAFFPEWIRVYIEFLPFKLIAATPLEIYLGKRSGYELYWTLLEMLSWGLALFVLSETLWKYAFKRLSIQGG